ncbi:MAG: penicillin-binding protein 2 [Opitutaceae bacterium]|nr:penicillin-binding protein 2 [Opitutaceae bacterium]
MSRGFASNSRIILVSVIVILSLAGIGTRLVFLHIIDREELLGQVEQVRRQVIVEHARRGNIYDSHLHLLAANQSVYNVGVDPRVLRPEDRAKWPALASLLGVPFADLERIMTTTTRQARVPSAPGSIPTAVGVVFRIGQPATNLPTLAAEETTEDSATDATREKAIRWAKLAEDVNETTYEQVVALDIKGVYGNRIYRRVYPHNALAAHLVGYVNKAGVAAAGVENYADFYLRGQDGWREGERDGRRRELAQFRTREVQPVDGFNVVLSTDIIIQHMVEEELEAIAKKFNPAKATIIVSDAKTGFILALGNYPSFDLNAYNTAPLDVQRNFAITDQLDPGSTFKIVAAAGALNEGLVRPNTRFDCSIDSILYKGAVRRFMPDDHKYDHLLTVAEIISRSSNIGAAQLGMLLGEQRMYDYSSKFGFGEKSGFPFGGEISGTLNPVSKWSGIDITRIPAGYSISATPLQIHYAMGVIASGGELFRPQIIRQVRDSLGEVVYSFDSAVRRRVISTQVARDMARMLKGVTEKGGTADNAAIPGYEIAGKTGTAQKLINGAYSKRNHIGSFVGFFPASRPEVVISVIVDDAKVPGGNAYGRTVGAPSFKRLAEQLIQYLDIKPPFEPGRKPLFAMKGNPQ